MQEEGIAEMAELKDRPEVQEKLARRIASCSVKARRTWGLAAGREGAAAAQELAGGPRAAGGAACGPGAAWCSTAQAGLEAAALLQVLNPPRPGKKLLVADIDYTSE